MPNSDKQDPLSERFEAKATKLEAMAEEPASNDDPSWLRRMAGKWRARARKRERGLEHKQAQRQRKGRDKR